MNENPEWITSENLETVCIRYVVVVRCTIHSCYVLPNGMLYALGSSSNIFANVFRCIDLNPQNDKHICHWLISVHQNWFIRVAFFFFPVIASPSSSSCSLLNHKFYAHSWRAQSFLRLKMMDFANRMCRALFTTARKQGQTEGRKKPNVINLIWNNKKKENGGLLFISQNTLPMWTHTHTHTPVNSLNE